MNNKCLYQANPNFIMRKIAGQDVLVAIGREIADFRGYIKMNATAACIWQMLKNKVAEDEIIEQVVAEFDAPRELIENDVRGTLNALIERKMVMKYDE